VVSLAATAPPVLVSIGTDHRVNVWSRVGQFAGALLRRDISEPALRPSLTAAYFPSLMAPPAASTSRTSSRAGSPRHSARSNDSDGVVLGEIDMSRPSSAAAIPDKKKTDPFALYPPGANPDPFGILSGGSQLSTPRQTEAAVAPLLQKQGSLGGMKRDVPDGEWPFTPWADSDTTTPNHAHKFTFGLGDPPSSALGAFVAGAVQAAAPTTAAAAAAAAAAGKASFAKISASNASRGEISAQPTNGTTTRVPLAAAAAAATAVAPPPPPPPPPPAEVEAVDTETQTAVDAMTIAPVTTLTVAPAEISAAPTSVGDDAESPRRKPKWSPWTAVLDLWAWQRGSQTAAAEISGAENQTAGAEISSATPTIQVAAFGAPIWDVGVDVRRRTQYDAAIVTDVLAVLSQQQDASVLTRYGVGIDDRKTAFKRTASTPIPSLPAPTVTTTAVAVAAEISASASPAQATAENSPPPSAAPTSFGLLGLATNASTTALHGVNFEEVRKMDPADRLAHFQRHAAQAAPNNAEAAAAFVVKMTTDFDALQRELTSEIPKIVPPTKEGLAKLGHAPSWVC
jgi:hypothetical protein